VAERLLHDHARPPVVVATLEDEGVQKFDDSFGSLLEGIDAKLSVVGAR
jgi:hypothetical protein